MQIPNYGDIPRTLLLDYKRETIYTLIVAMRERDDQTANYARVHLRAINDELNRNRDRLIWQDE